MDCPICFDKISADTGQVTTSCGHTFHFKCLNTWYYKQQQNEDVVESCPCCRREPGEYELGSIITEEEEEEEEEEESVNEEEDAEWLPRRRWVLTSEDTLQILARVASELPRVRLTKEEKFPIPSYNEEARAYWLLRNLFTAETNNNEPLVYAENIHPLDKAKMVRKRRRSFGREFWSHMGEEYELENIDGYKTD